MEPRIRYAKTSDGVDIAFWTLGEGPPLVYMPMIPNSHLQVEWQLDACRRWYERLSHGRMIVRYDNRGSGLSDRIISDYSPEALVRDLEAVVEQLKLEQFALMGLHRSGPIAVAYAADHPERITRLILWCTWARTASYMEPARFQTLRRMLNEGDWQLGTETIAREFTGWSEGPLTRAVAERIRQSTTQEVYRAIVDALAEFDASSFLPQIRCPTLILHPNNVPLVPVDMARQVAAGIADARLALVDGEALFPFIGDHEAKLQAIDEFLSEGEEPPEYQPELPSGTAVILFADIVDSTALTERLGDAAFREKARELDTELRTVIKEAGGTPVEGRLVGDGLMAVSTSAHEAIEAARRCGAAGESAGLPLHLGIHAGDVIREENNVYGGAVNIASRISGLSAPGEVLVSDTVRGLARTSAGVSFEDRGEHALKGVAEPQRVWAVREQSAGS
ncbi:MAG: adenylate/guanylate cyclase domain-containing protein [Dehalococcoidia bacterium]|nr:adenylate/guanylate cyclase domain-containing protein [Dehalococcoidia bacterium]